MEASLDCLDDEEFLHRGNEGGMNECNMGKGNLLSFWNWFVVQLVISAAIVMIAWFVMTPANARIDAPMMALEAKLGRTTSLVR